MVQILTSQAFSARQPGVVSPTAAGSTRASRLGDVARGARPEPPTVPPLTAVEFGSPARWPSRCRQTSSTVVSLLRGAALKRPSVTAPAARVDRPNGRRVGECLARQSLRSGFSSASLMNSKAKIPVCTPGYERTTSAPLVGQAAEPAPPSGRCTLAHPPVCWRRALAKSRPSVGFDLLESAGLVVQLIQYAEARAMPNQIGGS